MEFVFPTLTNLETGALSLKKPRADFSGRVVSADFGSRKRKLASATWSRTPPGSSRCAGAGTRLGLRQTFTPQTVWLHQTVSFRRPPLKMNRTNKTQSTKLSWKVVGNLGYNLLQVPLRWVNFILRALWTKRLIGPLLEDGVAICSFCRPIHQPGDGKAAVWVKHTLLQNKQDKMEPRSLLFLEGSSVL